MSQEWIEFIISIASMVLSDLDYIFSMLLVVIVAACFLGRYIVLSRKLVLSTLSVIGVTVIGTVAVNVVLTSMGYTDKVDIDTNMFINSIFNAAIFVYSLIFYFFAFKEKRILRAIESAICLYLVRLYLSTFSQMAVVYFAGLLVFEAITAAVYSRKYTLSEKRREEHLMKLNRMKKRYEIQDKIRELAKEGGRNA